MLAYFDRRDRETLSQKALQQLAALRAANTASR
jgi:hypothetical protein